MDAKLYVSRLGGAAAVPPSKSAANRTVLCAGLSQGVSRLDNLEYSADISVMLDAITQLGARVQKEEHAVTIQGRGASGGFVTVTRPVWCGESGSALRFLLPTFSLTGQKVRFEQDRSGITVFGRLQPGTFRMPGDVSSQFISGLLFAAPLMEEACTIEVSPPFESRSYVGLTLDAMQRFGVKVSSRTRKDGTVVFRIPAPQTYKACDLAIEGDYSQAAFLAVLGSLVGGIAVTGLAEDTHQGDKAILDILQRCGAKFHKESDGLHFERSLMWATEIDLADCPALGPVLFTLATFCGGATVIRNAGRLRLKESDRIEAMAQELAKMGARVQVDGDTVTIPQTALHTPGVPLYGHNDHRIVMALAVAAYGAGIPVTILGAEAVNKSWPGFFEVLQSLGAKIELI